MTLTEFLLARIAEDESIARLAIAAIRDDRVDDRDYPGLVTMTPDRLLVECEAKRQTLTLHLSAKAFAPVRHACTECGDGNQPWPCPTLRLLSLPYANHPDYDPTWAPMTVGDL